MSTSKILVVDDEPFICRSLTFVLKKGNYEVLEARNGEDALAAIREHKPDLVFLDVMMPKVNGFEVTQAVRSDAALEVMRLAGSIDEALHSLCAAWGEGGCSAVRISPLSSASCPSRERDSQS